MNSKKIIGWLLTILGIVVAGSSYMFKRVCIGMCDPSSVDCISPCANLGFDFIPLIVLIGGAILLIIGVITLIKSKNNVVKKK